MHHNDRDNVVSRAYIANGEYEPQTIVIVIKDHGAGLETLESFLGRLEHGKPIPLGVSLMPEARLLLKRPGAAIETPFLMVARRPDKPAIPGVILELFRIEMQAERGLGELLGSYHLEDATEAQPETGFPGSIF